MAFHLHEQLANDCVILGHLPLSLVLLSRDANYPWLILVPQRDGVSEIYQLNEADQQQLTRESVQLAALLAREFHADKMNVAAIGNVVPQLHLHHVVRYRSDPTWPAPVWGKLPPRQYDDQQLEQIHARLHSLLAGIAGFTASD